MSGQEDKSKSQFTKKPKEPDPALRRMIESLPEYKEFVRVTLLNDARDGYYKTLNTFDQTTYGRDLRALEERLNAHLRTDIPNLGGAVILDPAKFDTGMALGLSSSETVRVMIDRKAPDPPAIELERMFDIDYLTAHPKRSDGYWLPGIAEDMGKKFTTKFGLETYTQFPVEQSFSAVAGCIIVPGSEKENPYKVKGLSHEDNLSWINLHESWHCRDRRDDNLAIADTAAYGAFKPEDDIRKLPDNADVRKLYARNNQMECFADAAAAGEMIRSGKPLSILDAVVDYRQEGAWEVRHYTVPALKGLQAEIEKMGVEKFRKLDEKQAEALYNKVVDAHALTERRVEILQRNESKNPLKSAPFMVTRFTDAELSTASAFRRSQNIDKFVTAARELVSPTARTDPQLTAKLAKWDASAVLKDKAFATDHKITPTTLVKAYATLQDELRAQIKKDPAQTSLYEAQMTKLQAAFVNDVPKMDYLQVNRDRGVSLPDIEPSLKKVYDPPKAQEAKPKTSKPAGQEKVKL